jgi:hypothetical protein
MIDKRRFLKWLKLPARAVEFSANGETDPLKPTANIVVTIDKQKFRYHARQTATGFILEETSFSVGNPTGGFIDDDSTDRDAAEFDESSCEAVLPSDSLDDILAEQFQDLNLPKSVIEQFARWHEQQIETARESALATNLRSVVAMFLSPGNLSLRAWALAFAAGLDAAEGKSMTEVGRELGVTRAAVSKETNRWTDLLGLNRSRYMKSETARKSYSTVQKRNHWRKGDRK